MNKLLVLFAIVIGLLSKTYAFDTAKLDKQITETYPVDVRSCEEENNKESCLTVSSNILTAAIDSTGDKKQYLTNKAVTYYNKACRNTQNASSDIKKACPMVYNQIKTVQGFKRVQKSKGVKLTLGSCTKGSKVYNKKLKWQCGMSEIQFARKNSQHGWEILAYPTDFFNEIIQICGDLESEYTPSIKKHLSDIYAFVHKYARDSGEVPGISSDCD